MFKSSTAILTAALLLTTACVQQGDGYQTRARTSNGSIGGSGISKGDVGGLAGAATGAIVGSNVGKGKGNIAAIAIGTLLGAGIGNEIGSSLDRADMAYYNSTSQRAMETAQAGEALPWKNPDTGNSGTITPSNYYQTASGQYCREYTQTINVGGKNVQGHGTACREQDGSWKIIE